MLVIRDTQLEALGRTMVFRFQRKMLAHLRQMQSEGLIALEESDFAGHIERGLREAERFDVRTEADVARYVGLVCRYLGGFHEKAHPKEAVTILKTYGASAEARLDRLEQWCRQTGGRSAARR
jgi:hypothetical protein